MTPRRTPRTRSLAASLGASLAALFTTLVVACDRRPRIPDGAVTLGGVRVEASTLRRGRDVYGAYCLSCHGEQGDGRGPLSAGLRPPPRDLRLGIVKFAAVPSGRLPRDEDLARIVRHGLAGTAMRGWELPDADLAAVVQYVKTFAPRFRRERAGAAIAPTADPWAGRVGDGVRRGEALYHGLAMCWTCHPAYATREAIGAFTREIQGEAVREFRADLYGSVVQPTDYGVRALPPDFLRHPVKSGARARDVYRTLAAGVGGTPMPGWRDVLPEADIWALAHYVASLAAMRDTREGEALARRVAGGAGAE